MTARIEKGDTLTMLETEQRVGREWLEKLYRKHNRRVRIHPDPTKYDFALTRLGMEFGANVTDHLSGGN